jgi:hypothetical protein
MRLPKIRKKTNEAVNTEKPSQMDEKEGITIWKEAGGLQAGLGYLSGEHRVYLTGEKVKLVV